MRKFTYVLATLAFFTFMSCKTQQPAVTEAPEPVEPEVEERQLDTMVVSAPQFDLDEVVPEERTFELPKFNPSHTREHDLLHTALDLKFDWENEQVIGQANLKLTPYFYATDSLVRDAKGFEFNKVAFAKSGQELDYDYDGQQIVIRLGKEYTRKDTFDLFIDYVATPAASGGSAAITSDKGLFFIDPRDEDPEKPSQIWTQGETENNSRWFPTIDKPNERMTQEITLTVEDKYKTLSNGLLVKSTKNDDGTRTDYWVMDMPHAPYLAMLAIGEFAVVKEEWNDIPVEYYVEPKYEEYAKDIFPYTPEMLTLFSEQLDYPYPWQKYSQVAVRDYVSGAMENTTAVIFGEFMQGTDRELIDELTNEKIVAHELYHHWFGDLVTTESWANLTLQEGFANYSEFLWLEHKYGADEAAYHRFQEQQGYLQSAQNGVHPLIHYGYDDKEEMFDAHSYNKGGLVLHMLRKEVGDEAFFAALNRYLTGNEFTAVEVDELRMAFEDLTGRSMIWFFDQWFHNQGHPSLTVESEYDATAGKVILTVEQTQDPDMMPPIFQLPVAVDIYNDSGEAVRKKIMIDQRAQTFEFEVPAEPKLVNFDADNMLLAVKTEELSEEEYIFQYNNAPGFMDRLEALQNLNNSGSEAAMAVMEKALQDDFYALRGYVLSNVDPAKEENAKIIADMAVNDPHSAVRNEALAALASLEDPQYADAFAKAIENDKSYDVIAAGLRALYAVDQEQALAYAKKMEDSENGSILTAVSEIYADSDDVAANRGFYEEKWDEVDGFNAINFFESYSALVSKGDVETILDAAETLKKVSTTDGQSLWRKLSATKTINELHAELTTRYEDAEEEEAKNQIDEADAQLLKMITDIKQQETDMQLKQIYNNFPNPAPRP